MKSSNVIIQKKPFRAAIIIPKSKRTVVCIIEKDAIIPGQTVLWTPTKCKLEEI